jgi:hypothetical protein
VVADRQRRVAHFDRVQLGSQFSHLCCLLKCGKFCSNLIVFNSAVNHYLIYICYIRDRRLFVSDIWPFL